MDAGELGEPVPLHRQQDVSGSYIGPFITPLFLVVRSNAVLDKSRFHSQNFPDIRLLEAKTCFNASNCQNPPKNGLNGNFSLPGNVLS